MKLLALDDDRSIHIFSRRFEKANSALCQNLNHVRAWVVENGMFRAIWVLSVARKINGPAVTTTWYWRHENDTTRLSPFDVEKAFCGMRMQQKASTPKVFCDWGKFRSLYLPLDVASTTNVPSTRRLRATQPYWPSEILRRLFSRFSFPHPILQFFAKFNKNTWSR